MIATGASPGHRIDLLDAQAHDGLRLAVVGVLDYGHDWTALRPPGAVRVSVTTDGLTSFWSGVNVGSKVAWAARSANNAGAGMRLDSCGARLVPWRHPKRAFSRPIVPIGRQPSPAKVAGGLKSPL